MLTQRQSGFTLVELMVTMVVGTIIILGAGQLFLTTFQTFQKVEELSRKQETVVFAANMLVNEYRKGETGYTLQATPDVAGECSIHDPDNEPVVGGLSEAEVNGIRECHNARFIDDKIGFGGQVLNGYRKFTLDFKRDDESLEALSFYVMDRGEAINQQSDNGDENTPDPNNPGFFEDGARMYNDKCYAGNSDQFKPKFDGCNAP